eukprot:m.378662 g.378662  ORF g.378662 m.378662 type:complete len:106 (-) comp20027_c1_seq2:136-453(-)
MHLAGHEVIRPPCQILLDSLVAFLCVCYCFHNRSLSLGAVYASSMQEHACLRRALIALTRGRHELYLQSSEVLGFMVMVPPRWWVVDVVTKHATAWKEGHQERWD